MADGATYSLSVLIKLQSQLARGLGKDIAALKGFKRETDSALKAYAKLNTKLSKSLAPPKAKGLLPELEKASKLIPQMGAKQAADAARVLKLERERAKLAKEEAGAARAQARFAVEGESHALRLQRESLRLEQQQARTRRESQQASSAAELSDLRHMREQMKLRRESERGRRRVGFLERVGNLGTRAESLRSAAGSFRAAFDATKPLVDPALEQMRAEARFRMMGFPEKESAGGLDAVARTLREVKGVKRAEVIETLTALTGTFGDVEQASSFLPIAARYMANMKALQGDQSGPAEIARQIQNTFKSLELLGVDRPTGPRDASGQRTFTPDDRARMEHYFDLIAQSGAATGGDINPAEFRNFVKYARMSGQGITPEGMVKLLPLIPQMGGSQLGTALMSLSTNLIGGTLPAYRVREWDRLGLVRHKDDKGQPLVEYSKTEEIKRMRPGAIPMAETLLRDPVGFADQLATHLKGKGVDTSDFEATNKQLYAMFGSRTSSGVMAQMINFRESLRKESANYERVPGINAAYKTLFEGQSPIAGILDAQAKWYDAQARAGAPIAGFEGRAGETVSNFMLAHPDMAAGLAGVKALGTASTEAASGVGSLASALAGLRGGGGGGAGGIAGTGVGASDVATSSYVGWRALKWGGGLGATLLSKAAGPLAILSTAAASMYAIHDQYEYDTAKRQKAEGGAAEGFEQLKKLREREGGTLPAEVAKARASLAFPGVDRRGLLYELDTKTYGTGGMAGMSAGPKINHDEVMAGAFARRAPEMQFPEIMRGFIQDIRARQERGELNKAPGDAILKVAQQAFPDSFKKASEEAASELSKVSPAADSFRDQLQRMGYPMAGFMYGMSEAQGAASSFAARLNGLELRAPVITVGPTGKSRFGVDGPLANPLDLFKPPQSAVGSVVHRDGLVMAHKGNVITPARLSRKRPGDWLETIHDARGNALSFGGDHLSVHAPVSIRIDGASDPLATAATVRAEMESQRAQLEHMISRLTGRRRIERVLAHRKDIYEEKAS